MIPIVFPDNPAPFVAAVVAPDAGVSGAAVAGGIVPGVGVPGAVPAEVPAVVVPDAAVSEASVSVKPRNDATRNPFADDPTTFR